MRFQLLLTTESVGKSHKREGICGNRSPEACSNAPGSIGGAEACSRYIQCELRQTAGKYARRAAHCKSGFTSGIHHYTTEAL